MMTQCSNLGVFVEEYVDDDYDDEDEDWEDHEVIIVHVEI